MKSINPYTAILVSVFLSSCGLAPAPTTTTPNKKYSDLKDVVCSTKGGDTDDDGICNADEIASAALGPTCVDNTVCDGVTPDDERTDVDDGSGKVSSWWILGGILAGGVAGGIYESTDHPIGNLTSWFKGNDQEITTSNGDVIKIDGRTIVSEVSKFQFTNRGSTPYLMLYTKTQYDDDVTGHYNGQRFRFNKQAYQCVIAELILVPGSMVSSGDTAQTQFKIPGKNKKISMTTEDSGFEDKCLNSSDWESGVYFSGEKGNQDKQIKIHERSAKKIGYDYGNDKFFRKTNTVKFSNFTVPGSISALFITDGAYTPSHLIEFNLLNSETKNTLLNDTTCNGVCKANLLLQITDSADLVRFKAE